jgi:hypothetical protein
MTEAEWLACREPVRMVWWLRGRTTDRKLRLFACGLGRRVWDRLRHDDLRRAVEVAERAADGHATAGELEAVSDAAFRAVALNGGVRAGWTAANSAYPDVHHAAAAGATQAGMTGLHKAGVTAVLRDVFGNPFRPVAFAPEWRTDTAVALARQMYDARDFSAMPILADALQDAGCDNSDVLDHCRDSTLNHVHGCWVCDLVLDEA